MAQPDLDRPTDSAFSAARCALDMSHLVERECDPARTFRGQTPRRCTADLTECIGSVRTLTLRAGVQTSSLNTLHNAESHAKPLPSPSDAADRR